MSTVSTPSQAKQLTRYYKWHAPIYDATRWSFLFGRQKLIHLLPNLPNRSRILEVGCGTGRNLKRLAQCYPSADIIGMDLAPPMLRQAARQTRVCKNVKLIRGQYGPVKLDSTFDLIVLSYSLTMMEPEMVKKVMTQLHHDLAPGGYIGVVDFHRTPVTWFRSWMNKNHVTINRRLFSRLTETYKPIRATSQTVYFGLWSYFLFLGQVRE